MNYDLIRRLILKDWFFLRLPIALYIAGGIGSLVLLARPSMFSFYIGSTLLLTVVITIGIHLVMATVVEERTKQTLPFIMSLPISALDYTIAKILANLLLFVLPWLTLAVGTVAVIAGSAAIPDGLIPFAILVLTWLVVAYCLILTVALVTESQAWTIGTMVVTNLALQAFLYLVSNQPAIAAEMKGQAILWSSPSLAILGVEVGAIVLLLASTFFLQARKTDFL